MLLDQFATFLRYLGLATCDIDVSSPVFTTEKMIHHKFCGTTGTSKTFLQHRQPRHSGQWNMTSNITGTWMTGLGMVEAPDMTESSLRHAPDHVQDIAWTWPGHSWVLAWAALGPWSGKSLNWILLIPGSSVSINLTLLGVLLTHFFVLPSNSSCPLEFPHLPICLLHGHRGKEIVGVFSPIDFLNLALNRGWNVAVHGDAKDTIWYRCIQMRYLVAMVEV